MRCPWALLRPPPAWSGPGCRVRAEGPVEGGPSASLDLRGSGARAAGRALRSSDPRGRQLPELPPLPFGDHLDRAVDDLDSRLFVDRVGRDPEAGGPPLRVSHRV